MDLYFFNLINQYAGQCKFLDNLAIFFAEYLQYIVVFLLLLFLLKDFKKYLRMVVSAIAAAILARFVITEIIRYFIPRIRPFIENNINLIINHDPDESSFPSGHAALFFAMATAVYFYNKKLGIFFFISAFLISISRVSAGIHWPSDIIAGTLVGIFSGLITDKILKKFFKQKELQ